MAKLHQVVDNISSKLLPTNILSYQNLTTHLTQNLNTFRTKCCYTSTSVTLKQLL